MLCSLKSSWIFASFKHQICSEFTELHIICRAAIETFSPSITYTNFYGQKWDLEYLTHFCSYSAKHVYIHSFVGKNYTIFKLMILCERCAI